MDTKVAASDRIDVRDNFNLLDYRTKCPYEDETHTHTQCLPTLRATRFATAALVSRQCETHSACLRCALRASLRLRWSVGSVS